MNGRRRGRSGGFSLIELIVVIALIAVLVGLLVPAVIRSRESAKTIQCASQLRQLGQAFANYAAHFDGHLPYWSGWHVAGGAPGGDGTGEDEPGPGWTEQLAPFFVPPTSSVYNCPAFVEGYPINYFLSSRYVRQHGRRSLLLGEIKQSSDFVLSGDTTGGHLYPPSFGWAPLYTTNDCDKDDAVQPALLFHGEEHGFNVHRAGNNVLFGDFHVAALHRFDPARMTFHPHERGMSWKAVPSELFCPVPPPAEPPP
jgi:prepilin-type N-terminal cleavage/methylation domain-containing protein